MGEGADGRGRLDRRASHPVPLCHPRRVTEAPGPVDPQADPLTEITASASIVRTQHADDRLVRRLDAVRLVIAAALAVLGLVALELLLDDGPRLPEVLVVLLTGVIGLALLVHHRVAAAIALRRASREASMTRILQGLSRSLSPDSVVDAIVQELTSASGADHVVVARVRQDQVVEVTLSAARASVPSSRTYLRPDVPGLSTDDLADDADDAEDAAEAADTEPVPAVPVSASVAAASAASTSARLEGHAARESAADSAASLTTVAGRTTDATGASGGTATSVMAAPTAQAARAVQPGVRPRRPGFGMLASGARAITQQVPGRRAQLASQAAADEIARKVRSAYGLPYTLAAPLVAEGRFLGALILSKRTRESWSDGDRRLLGWAAREVAAAFARAYALEEAERGAHTDALTGLPNRRSFDDLIAIVPHRRRANDDLGILMVDIDRFKSLNDRHGHATGDSVLRAVAAAIAATVRAEDTPARYGGEEFAVILRRASAPQAAEVAERVRRAVATMPPERLGVDLPVTVSVGVAVADPDEDIAAVIERADQALYLAKRRGRDRVEIG